MILKSSDIHLLQYTSGPPQHSFRMELMISPYATPFDTILLPFVGLENQLINELKD